MGLKPLEVTRPSLAHHCTSPCSGGSHNTRLHNDVNRSAYSLYKCLLIRARRWSAIAPWMTSTSVPSNCSTQVKEQTEISFLVELVVYVPLLIDLHIPKYHVHFVFRTPKVMFSNLSVPYTIHHVYYSHKSPHISHNMLSTKHATHNNA